MRNRLFRTVGFFLNGYSQAGHRVEGLSKYKSEATVLLAERHRYPWFKRLNQNNYDLGSGKRVIAEHGVLDQKYLITVPLPEYWLWCA